MTAARPDVPAPMAMLAELTHRCPLSCPYCSNPLELVRKSGELTTAEWADVFIQAAGLGVLQIHLSGGEPASRPDLEDLVSAARTADLYTNLITSGVGLTENRLAALDAAGLDHVQLSLQGVTAGTADRIGGYEGGFDRKMRVARWVTDLGLPLTLNAVMHKQNLDQLPETIQLAADLGARRIEVATVQFHGWAAENRAALMPTRAQAREAARIVERARKTYEGRLVIDYVPADHHARFPKPCMGGWGNAGLTVSPDGTVLPCHAARTIPSLEFETVRAAPLAGIWYGSASFNAFRGTDWMREPCRSCDRREVDFGGCRCQAMALTGDAAAADPVCVKSPFHEDLAARAEADGRADGAAFVYRTFSRAR